MNKKAIFMIIAIVLILALIVLVIGGNIAKASNKLENPIATIKIQGYDTPIVAELYPDQALNTVKNFIALSNNGFYNGIKIHRIEPNFVIQGGDPDGDGTGGPTLADINPSIEKDSDADKKYSIDGEFTANGYDNNVKHERGTLAMARSTYSADLIEEGFNSAGSQFYICLNNAPNLNGQYAAFGKVISGMETVDAISQVELSVETDDSGVETKTNKPANDVVIESITVDTKGIEYGIPETHDEFDFSSWYMKQYGLSY